MRVINEELNKAWLEDNRKCHCCNKLAIEGYGRVFVMGYWVCHECEDKCSPDDDGCQITGHIRMS